MAIFIENILDVHSIEAICDSLDDSHFEDGKKTAGRTAKQVKQNTQGVSENTIIKGATRKIEQALMDNSEFQNSALPKQIAKVMLSRYEKGMHYGNHIDDAFINNTRTDLSFTLFLSKPESYEGGELVICKSDGEESIKAPQGSLYLYPSDAIHRVEPVTKGIRLVAIGWIQSRIKHEAQRNILLNLDLALKQLVDSAENQSLRLNLLQTKNNLLRMWSE